MCADNSTNNFICQSYKEKRKDNKKKSQISPVELSGTCHVSCITCQLSTVTSFVSHVVCHVLCVMYGVSHVTCHYSELPQPLILLLLTPPLCTAGRFAQTNKLTFFAVNFRKFRSQNCKF